MKTTKRTNIRRLPPLRLRTVSLVGGGAENWGHLWGLRLPNGPSAALNKHLAWHSQVKAGGGKKPFACEHCGKRFSQQKILKTHVKVHTGGTMFGCEQCGKRFCQPSQLRAHRTVHTGERPYACSCCGRKFRRNTDLTVHMRGHTGSEVWI
ncbi:unnamed protein product [Menidia menidia]|uniref:(Atlantic silverside) hypothetical protein n=1 Tax=Menidia menidia TaxID=238744 RepID=A0A8S4ATF7_9TELE|nr:unnamed protein product [Menidia menidia]